MKLAYPLATTLLLVTTLTSIRAAEDDPAAARREWNVGGTTREALVYASPTAKSTSSPLVFIFHGHNGTMQGISQNYQMHQLWPEAIVVYPQGLNTTSSRDPEGKQAGWQRITGQDKDRDLQFFDAMLGSLKRDYQVDTRRIYVTGHSNGGAFTYLLWAARGDIFAALAPSGSVVLLPAEQARAQLPPRPLLHIAGEKDEVVKFEKQKETMDLVRVINQCGPGEPWGPEHCTLHASKLGAPLVTYIHPRAHGFPRDAKAVVLKFFQAHTRR